jgi:very-short-patch-repair endonuclease
MASLTNDPFQTQLNKAIEAFRARDFSRALEHALRAKLIHDRSANQQRTPALVTACNALTQKLGEFIKDCSRRCETVGATQKSQTPSGLSSLKAPPAQPYIPQRESGRSPAPPKERRAPPTKDTPIELRLFKAIQDHGRLPAPEKQFRFTKDGKLLTIADFAYTREKVAIFCDGFRYHGNKDALASDAEKRNELQAHGWIVLTFWGKYIYNRPARCAEQIWNAYCSRPH